jgi:hypothetical protein
LRAVAAIPTVVSGFFGAGNVEPWVPTQRFALQSFRQYSHRVQLFDLFFISGALLSVIVWIRLLLLMFRGRRSDAGALLTYWTMSAVAYLAIVVVTSLLTPRRWIALHDEQCFDEWCVSVLDARRMNSDYQVTLRVASHSRRRPQRAADADVRLVDTTRNSYSPEPTVARSLQSVLQPGESFDTVRLFGLPSDKQALGLDVIHGAWPEWFIIGDRGSLLHKPTLVRLDN